MRGVAVFLKKYDIAAPPVPIEPLNRLTDMQRDHTPAEIQADRAELDQHLMKGRRERQQVWAALTEATTPPDGDLPPLPDDVRQVLEERFGTLEPAAAPAPSRPAATSPGLLVRVQEFLFSPTGRWLMPAAALLVVMVGGGGSSTSAHPMAASAARGLAPPRVPALA